MTRTTADFLSKIVPTRREWNEIFKVLQKKKVTHLQQKHTLKCVFKHAFKDEGKIDTFFKQVKTEEIHCQEIGL
jgi:hypothetical protein